MRDAERRADTTRMHAAIVAPPIQKTLPGVDTQASERIWMNVPPARVWVYRKG